jgi:hypothetical protein
MRAVRRTHSPIAPRRPSRALLESSTEYAVRVAGRYTAACAAVSARQILALRVPASALTFTSGCARSSSHSRRTRPSGIDSIDTLTVLYAISIICGRAISISISRAQRETHCAIAVRRDEECMPRRGAECIRVSAGVRRVHAQGGRDSALTRCRCSPTMRARLARGQPSLAPSCASTSPRASRDESPDEQRTERAHQRAVDAGSQAESEGRRGGEAGTRTRGETNERSVHTAREALEESALEDARASLLICVYACALCSLPACSRCC